jgi:hypothetical protein
LPATAPPLPPNPAPSATSSNSVNTAVSNAVASANNAYLGIYRARKNIIGMVVSANNAITKTNQSSNILVAVIEKLFGFNFGGK